MTQECWEQSEDKCPKCGNHFEDLISTNIQDGHEYIDAQRCKTCRYQFNFVDGKPEFERI